MLYNLHILHNFCLRQELLGYTYYHKSSMRLRLIAVDFEDDELPIETEDPEDYNLPYWLYLENIVEFPYYDALLKDKPLLRLL